METSFRHYDDDFVVFEQHFVRGMSLEPKPWGSDLQTPHSLFPSFRSTGAAKEREFLTLSELNVAISRLKRL